MLLSLKDELRSIEDAFVVALMEGGEALAAFELRWENLTKDIDEAQAQQCLDADTARLAHSTSIRLAALADVSADILTIQEDITSDLVNQLGCLMSELTLVADDSSSSPSTASILSRPILPDTTSSRKRRRDPDNSSRRTRKRQRYVTI